MGRAPWVVLSSPSAVHEAFVLKGDAFSGRPMVPSMSISSGGGPSGKLPPRGFGQLALTSFGTPRQRKITRRVASSLGQPRSIGRGALAGRSYILFSHIDAGSEDEVPLNAGAEPRPGTPPAACLVHVPSSYPALSSYPLAGPAAAVCLGSSA